MDQPVTLSQVRNAISALGEQHTQLVTAMASCEAQLDQLTKLAQLLEGLNPDDLNVQLISS
jgi:hypothetical protein